MLSLVTFSAQAQWEVKSDFQLQLTESLFDTLINDFSKSMQGTQTISVPNYTFTAMGLPISVNGIKANVNYSFPAPVRTAGQKREWNLASTQLEGRILVDSATTSTIIEKVVNGIRVRIRVNAECHNISLHLAPGMTSVQASINADVVDNQIKLTMPTFNADWRQGAWAVESITCTGIEGIDGIVRAQVLQALSNFQNFDAQVRTKLDEQFVAWSHDASLLMLSERELPTGKDYLKLFYEPTAAAENDNGLLLTGQLRFVYPFVALGQNIVQEYKLKVGADKTKAKTSSASPQLIMPFASIRSLMMGEYFAGKLEYSIRSYEIPAFQELMQSRWKQFWAWPDLMKFPTNTTFAFQMVPYGPPAFENEKGTGADVITGDLSLPLAVKMYAPVEGSYTPYVQFKTMMAGSSTLKLLKGGKIDFQLSATDLPVSYSWATAYVSKYNPTKRIAAETMASAAKNALSTDGFTLAIPNFLVGKAVKLVPEHWTLQGGNLTLGFTTGSSAK